MAKKAKGKKLSGYKIYIIIVVVVLLIAAAVCIGLVVKHTNGVADTFKTFYVEVDGKRYYNDSDITLRSNGTTNFNCGYMLSKTPGRYRMQIVSTCTEQTAFDYKINGRTYTFEDGVDYTECFNVQANGESGFGITCMQDTPLDVLKRANIGKTVESGELDPAISYFKLIVMNEDATQGVSFALHFGYYIKLDPDHIIM